MMYDFVVNIFCHCGFIIDCFEEFWFHIANLSCQKFITPEMLENTWKHFCMNSSDLSVLLFCVLNQLRFRPQNDCLNLSFVKSIYAAGKKNGFRFKRCNQIFNKSIVVPELERNRRYLTGMRSKQNCSIASLATEKHYVRLL